MSDEKLGFCRLAWKIGKATGHGEWFDNTEEKALSSHIAPLNKEYGPGSHWIEYDNGDDSYTVTQSILNKVKNAPKASIS